MSNTFYINSVDKTSYIKRRSTLIEKRSDNKNRAFFDMSITASQLGTNDGLIVGQDVKIYEDTTLLFGGVIKKIKIRRDEAGLGNDKKLTVAVTCNDYNDIPSRRVTSSYFTDTDAGTIVEAMVDDVLGLTGFDDGVGKGTISTGATINVYSVNAKSVKDVLDDMAEASGFKWYIDDSKNLYFVQDDTVTDAAHDLVETAPTFTDFYVEDVEVNIVDYRNKQWVLGAVDDAGENVNVSATDSAEITARAAIEGGSGVYGNIINATEAQNVTDADVVAANGIKVYGQIPYYITFTSYTNDWQAGTKLMCNLPTMGISTDTYFLIESVELEDMGTTFMSTVTATRRDPDSFSTQRTETVEDYFSKIIKNATGTSTTGNASASGRVYDVATTLPISLGTTTVSRTFDHDFPDIVDLLTTLTFQYTASAAVTLTLAYKDGATTDYTFTLNLPSGTDTRTITIPELSHALGEHTFTIDMTASANSVLQLDLYLLTSRWEKYRDSYTGTSDTNFAEYILFVGGWDGTSRQSTVDAYDTSLTRTTPTALSVGTDSMSGASVGDYALFGGGYTSTRVLTVYAYDKSLTQSTPTALSVARNNLSGASVGDYALFGGGYSNSSVSVSTVDAYDSSLTRTTPTALSVARHDLATSNMINYALFGGGIKTGGVGAGRRNDVDAYDTSLTRTTPTALSVQRNSLSGSEVGVYGLFGGGVGETSAVDAYDSSLTRTTPTALSVARDKLTGSKVGNYALFGGGEVGTTTQSTVDAYDTSLTRTTPTALSVARDNLNSGEVGNYALFGGGASSAVVDAYDTSLTRTTPTVLSVARNTMACSTV